jgi:hypothetical protein
MKRTVTIALQSTLFVLLLAALLFLFRDARDSRRPAYDAHAPATVKAARLARWIPGDADLVVTVDVPTLIAHPLLRARLEALTTSNEGVAPELLSLLLGHDGNVGMLALTGIVGAKGTVPALAVIAQGDFEKARLLPAVRSALSVGRMGLSARPLSAHTLYVESDARDPFGFVLLDDEHLAVGAAQALTRLFADARETPPAATPPPDAVLAGRLTITPRLAELAPPGLTLPSEIGISSPDGETISASLVVSDPAQALSLRLFLEGMRSLLQLQQSENAAVMSFLQNIAIESEGSRVIIRGAILPMLDLAGMLKKEA